MTDKQLKMANKLFPRICDAWGLSEEERTQLLAAGADGNLVLLVSYMLGIYKALHTLLPEPSRADAWIRRPNARFDGRPAIEVMLQPGGCAQVRKYLDAQLV